MSNSKLKIVFKAFIFFAFFTTFYLSNQVSVHAGIDSTFSGVCEQCGGTTGTYIWMTDKYGKYTLFVPDDEDGEILFDKGHKTFLIDNGNAQPIAQAIPMSASDVLFNLTTNDLEIVVNDPDGEVDETQLYVEVFDLQTGVSVIDETQFNSTTVTINISELSIGCRYSAVVSTRFLGIKVPITSYQFCKEIGSGN